MRKPGTVKRSYGKRAALVLGVTAVFVAFWFRGSGMNSTSNRATAMSSPTGIATVSASLPAESTASGRVTSLTSPSSHVANGAPVPVGKAYRIHVPENTPVAKVLEILKPAADAGDPAAACRIAIELARCLRLAGSTSMQAQLDAEVPKYPAGSPEAISASNRAAAFARHTSSEKLACSDVSAGEAATAWKYLYQAALGGNVAAMSRYVRDPGLGTADPAASAEGWLLYKQNAPQFLNAAVQGGDVMALYFAWWNAATGFSAGGAQVFEKDPYRAVIYGNAVMPLLDARRRASVAHMMPQLQAQLTPDQIAKAAVESQQLRDTHFASADPAVDNIDDAYVQPSQCEK